MPDATHEASGLSVIDAMSEARAMDFHGNTEDELDGCATPRIGRDMVEAELSFDLLDAEMRRAI